MNHEIADHNPRKQFTDAVGYAVQVTKVYLRLFRDAGIKLDGLRYLELGPGSDFAPQLVLASLGVRVTLADKFLSDWDINYHPAFYRAFLKEWPEPVSTIETALQHNDYSSSLTLIHSPAEDLTSVETGSLDFVQSNAVLEHVLDVRRVVRELARVTKPGGIQTHQVDYRYHRDFEHPLDHLLFDQIRYLELRNADKGNHGTAMRMPEMLELFSKDFWIWKAEVNSLAEVNYTASIRNQLPADSPYRHWPPQLLQSVGARFWLVRKDKIKRKPNEYRVGALSGKGFFWRRRRPAR